VIPDWWLVLFLIRASKPISAQGREHAKHDLSHENGKIKGFSNY